MLSLQEKAIIIQNPIGSALSEFRRRTRVFWDTLRPYLYDSRLYKLDRSSSDYQALLNTMLDLIWSLQPIPAARLLPSHNEPGSLSGQLALLFHRLDSRESHAATVVPLLGAVMRIEQDLKIWDLVYEAISTASGIGTMDREYQPDEFLGKPQYTEHAALVIPEVLEQIILNLPMLDILYCQGVSKNWKTTIDGSPSIQQRLYFQPIPDGKERFTEVFNPLLKEVFVEWFNGSSHFNPKYSSKELVSWIPIRRDEPERFTRPEASWRRMLFQQRVPASKETLICYYTGSSHGVAGSFDTLSVPSNYTMGQVYDRVEQLSHSGDIHQGSPCSNRANNSDLVWLFVMIPGSTEIPQMEFPYYPSFVQKRWSDHLNWCKEYFGMADNVPLTPQERALRKDWCKRYPRWLRNQIELRERALCSHVKQCRL